MFKKIDNLPGLITYQVDNPIKIQLGKLANTAPQIHRKPNWTCQYVQVVGMWWPASSGSVFSCSIFSCSHTGEHPSIRAFSHCVFCALGCVVFLFGLQSFLFFFSFFVPLLGVFLFICLSICLIRFGDRIDWKLKLFFSKKLLLLSLNVANSTFFFPIFLAIFFSILWCNNHIGNHSIGEFRQVWWQAT